jgi:hypothetical protein
VLHHLYFLDLVCIQKEREKENTFFRSPGPRSRYFHQATAWKTAIIAQLSAEARALLLSNTSRSALGLTNLYLTGTSNKAWVILSHPPHMPAGNAHDTFAFASLRNVVTYVTITRRHIKNKDVFPVPAFYNQSRRSSHCWNIMCAALVLLQNHHLRIHVIKQPLLPDYWNPEPTFWAGSACQDAPLGQ